MDFAYDARTEELRENLLEFMDSSVYPAESLFAEQLGQLPNRWAWTEAPVLAELQAEARRRGLWNLFLPGEHGGGLTNLQYAPLAEITGRALQLAPPALNCSAPDTGNMEVLALFGTEAQKSRWLEPLLNAEIRSSFAMTEPDVASSDATNIATRIERDGDEYVINGRKWWITGAMNPHAEIFIVMGKTDPGAHRHRQQSMILVRRDTPGVDIRRGMHVFGYDDHDHGGHAEIEFRDVRVPAENLIASEGDGFGIAQARLGPGRIHHCMRCVGVAERAIELMCARAEERVTFGKPLAEQGVIRDWIAEARVRVEQLRLLVLKAAWLMDTAGNKGAHTEIQAIKIAGPSTVEWILDKAIQVHGGGGLSQDFPLAAAFAANRTLRFADGPDEVHKNALARNELRRQATAREARAAVRIPTGPIPIGKETP
jgi:acyl-CoA dehydrogenase